MNNSHSLKLTHLIKKMELEVVYMPEGGEDREIYSADINRPALQLAGYFDHFDESRIQILGMVEHTYLADLDPDQRRKRIERLFEFKFPALIITRNLKLYDGMLDAASRYEIPIMRTSLHTSNFMSSIIYYLNQKLGAQLTRHGVLVEVYGEGILLTGESGVGKSETAIELVKRGHQLIADDAVVIKSTSSTVLTGFAPDLIRHFIELRGIGVINVRKIFGIGAILENTRIDMIINLENWDKNKVYDRMGLDTNYAEILDVKIPSMTVPVRPGRNLAIIIEVAAMNNRQKRMGYNAAEELNNKILKDIENAKGNE